MVPGPGPTTICQQWYASWMSEGFTNFGPRMEGFEPGLFTFWTFESTVDTGALEDQGQTWPDEDVLKGEAQDDRATEMLG